MSRSSLVMLTRQLSARNMKPMTAYCGLMRRAFQSASSATSQKESYQLVIVGGGAGGIAMAAKFAALGKGRVAIIEPAETHYYQPYWTLVGGGLKSVENSGRPMASLIPKNVVWIKDSVIDFSPKINTVHTIKGKEVSYDFLIVAMGIQLDFDKVKGLPEALETPGVCSNYSINTVTKTQQAMKAFKEGNAIFTFPNTPIKCAGAPQKIMYLTDDYFRKAGKRDKANIIYNTSLGVMFGAPKYAAVLEKVAKSKGISVNYKHNLIEVRPNTKEAIFEKLDSTSTPKETVTLQYEMLHVTPPMSAPKVLRHSPLADAAGYLDVNQQTLQHTKFHNVFGLGDCTNVPTSKTAAAVAGQCGVLRKNLKAAMKGKPLKAQYDGYTSCPLVTGNNKCIMAEFDFDLKPKETFPFDQGKERYTMFLVKKEVLPFLYWNVFLKGYWEGPKWFRKLLHLGFSS